MIRMKVSEIPEIGRNTQGVRIMKMRPEDGSWPWPSWSPRRRKRKYKHDGHNRHNGYRGP